MIYKKIFAALLSSVIAFSALTLSVGTLQADAATFSDINQSSVFVKQNTNVTCTLAANVMMLRRTAMMRGDKDWSSITESAARSTLWYEGVGMYHNYTYKNITVSHAYVNGNVRNTLINALKEHPEGIVAYDWSRPHAILLTDYTDGVFYCADPAGGIQSGRINAAKALISVDSVDAYWYVVSPDVKLTSTSTNSSSTSGNTSAASNSTKETWQITAGSGVNMRSGAGTSYSTVGGVPYNATVAVSKKSTAGGYTWGYTTYNYQSGWIALDYAKKISNASASELTSTTSVSASSISIGNTVTLKGSGSGGASPYTYAYYYRMNENDKWKVIKDYCSSTSVTYKPLQVGTYEIMIKVVDANKKVLRKYHTLTVKNALSSKTSVSASSIDLGKSVTLKTQGQYGTPDYTYAYYYRLSGTEKWYVIKDYCSDTSATYTPKKAGKYELMLKVIDSQKRIVRKYYDLTVNNVLTGTPSVSAKSIQLGESVTLKNQGQYGKTPYTYAYYYRLSGTEKWYVIKDYCSETSATYTPKKAGKYELMLKVIDDNNKIVRQYANLTVQ